MKKKAAGKVKPKTLPKGKTKGTRSQLARMLNLTSEAVYALCKRDVITVLPDGKVYLEDAIKEYHEKTNPAQRRELTNKADKNAGTSSTGVNMAVNYNEARARREVAEAALSELKLQEAEGKVIDAETAKRTFLDVVIAVRDRLLGVPQRVAPSLVGVHDESAVVDILNDEIQQALAGLDRNAFA